MPSADSLLIEAIKNKDLQRIKTLLEYGVSPNARLTHTDEDGDVIQSRLNAAEQAKSNIAHTRTAATDDGTPLETDDAGDESDSDSDVLVLYSPNPEVYEDEEDYHDEQGRQEWYPIQHAAYLPDSSRKDREHKATIMNMILDHRPDLLAVLNGKYRKSMAHPLAFLDTIDFDNFDKCCQGKFDRLDLQVEDLVWSAFDLQNVGWSVVDETGQTLLHLLAAAGDTRICYGFRITEKLSVIHARVYVRYRKHRYHVRPQIVE